MSQRIFFFLFFFFLIQDDEFRHKVKTAWEMTWSWAGGSIGLSLLVSLITYPVSVWLNDGVNIVKVNELSCSQIIFLSDFHQFRLTPAQYSERTCTLRSGCLNSSSLVISYRWLKTNTQRMCTTGMLKYYLLLINFTTFLIPY